MKTSKRSLIASIAVLCVCALSLSTATFAWFTAAETAQLQEVVLTVQAQSDIKIAALPSVKSNSQSPDWVTTLKQEDFIDESNLIEDEIHDMRPATATVNGEFEVPADRENDVNVDSGVLAEGAEMDVATSGWSEFTVYVRTTKQQAVVMTASDFAYKKVGNDQTSAVDALVLGVGNTTTILPDGGEVVLFADGVGLTAFEDGNGYYGEVTLYVWMDGDHEDCKNSNALSSKDYGFSLDFEYAA